MTVSGQIIGSTNATTKAEVEAGATPTRALRGTLRAWDHGSNVSYGQYHAAAVSGVVAAGTFASSALGFYFHYIPQFPPGSQDWKRRFLIRRVVVSAGADSTAFTAGIGAFNLYVAHGMSSADFGGAVGTPGGNENRLRATHAANGLTGFGISNTGVVTAGTRDRDGEPIGSVMFGVGATAGNPLLKPFPIFDARPGEYPLQLELGDGIELFIIMPATGTFKFAVAVDWSELSAYP